MDKEGESTLTFPTSRSVYLLTNETTRVEIANVINLEQDGTQRRRRNTEKTEHIEEDGSQNPDDDVRVNGSLTPHGRHAGYDDDARDIILCMDCPPASFVGT